MEIKNQLFIGGKWCNSSSGATFDVLNPATNEVITKVQKATQEDIQRAVESAHKAFKDVWRQTNPFVRSAILHKAAEVVEKNADFLAQVETDDVGKPIFESVNIDVASAAVTLHYFGDIAVDIGGEVIPAPYNEVIDYTVREPLGVVGAIIPWNFPFLIAARKLGSALAAGNTVVIKPSSLAPLSTLLLGACFQEAGLPEGVINVVTAAGPDVEEVFTKAGPLEEITFTGSTEIGTKLYGSCTRELKGCTLELGGKSPALVLPDCDMDETIAGTLFGAYLSQGECCCAATRMIVHEDVYDEYVKKFVAGAKAIKVGMPREEDCRMGALIHPDHFRVVMDYVESGKKQGARLLCGGNRLTDGKLAKGNFMAPTVFADVTSKMKIWQEEIFGPVIVIAKAKSVDEMVEMANDTKYGLAASIWTTNLKQAHSLVSRIDAGTVWFNLHNFVFPCGPYGGYKSSGVGNELGREGVLALTRTKNVMISLFEGGFKWY